MYDVSCRPSSFDRGCEERSLAHQIAFLRRGVFEHEVRGEPLIADSNHALFLNRDEAYRVAHPAGTGDDCTVFAFEEGLLWRPCARRSQPGPAWLLSAAEYCPEWILRKFMEALASPDPARRLRGSERPWRSAS